MEAGLILNIDNFVFFFFDLSNDKIRLSKFFSCFCISLLSSVTFKYQLVMGGRIKQFLFFLL